MSEDNIAIRLKFLIEKLGINSSQFADSCKIPRPTFSQILNGRNKKISDQIIRQIHEAYPNVSINWLLFNEGSMLIGSPSTGDGTEDSNNNSIIDTASQIFQEDVSANGEENIIDEMRIDTLKFPSDESKNLEKQKENRLKSVVNRSNYSEDEDIKSILNNPFLLDKIAQLNQKTRKVVSVTIYYDDSTFETFKPG